MLFRAISASSPASHTATWLVRRGAEILDFCCFDRAEYSVRTTSNEGPKEVQLDYPQPKRSPEITKAKTAI